MEPDKFVTPNNTAAVTIIWLTPAPNWLLNKTVWFNNFTKLGYSISTVDNDTRYLGGSHALMVIGLKDDTKWLWLATNTNGTQYIMSFVAEASIYYPYFLNDFNIMWDTFHPRGTGK